jgi:hypothetical protein
MADDGPGAAEHGSDAEDQTAQDAEREFGATDVDAGSEPAAEQREDSLGAEPHDTAPQRGEQQDVGASNAQERQEAEAEDGANAALEADERYDFVLQEPNFLPPFANAENKSLNKHVQVCLMHSSPS